MTFLVLKVLSGLEIDGMTEIFTLVQYVDDGGRTPTIYILECLVFVHALVVCRQISRGNEYLFFFQPAGNLIRTHALDCHGKDTLHNPCGIFVHKPLVSGFIPEIAINDCPCDVLAGFTFGLESGANFAACISCVILVHNVSERGKIVVPSGTVHAVIDGNETDTFLSEDFHYLTDFQIVTPKATHVLYQQIFHSSGFDFFHHCQKSGTVKASATYAIVRKMDWIREALRTGVVFQLAFLIGYAVGFAL